MKFKLKIFLFAMALIPAFWSCTDDTWNEHYYPVSTEVSSANLLEFMQTRPELSTFVQMLKIAGADSLLTKSQTYTIWAPVNEALNAVALTDTNAVRKIVLNHISHFSISTSGLTQKEILMLNGKVLHLEKKTDGYFLQDHAMELQSYAPQNGIVYTMNSYVPYIMNIWEYIQSAPGLDSLRNYVNSLTKLEFNENLSYVDGVLLDSIFTESNKILSKLGYINSESRSFAALLPDNDAWREYFDKVYPYYSCMDEDGGKIAQLANTRWTIVKDLFYQNIETQLNSDSLISTYASVFSNPAELLANTSVYNNSNGTSYVTNSLKFIPAESWFKRILVEAEDAGWGRTSGNYDLVIANSYGSGLNVSNDRYLSTTGTSTLSKAKLFVNFPIPNTLSGKYNIYAVFVPDYIADTASVRQFKLKFSLNYDYKTAMSGLKRDSVWANGNLLPETLESKAYTFYTEAKTVTKLKVFENYEFTHANMVNRNYQRSDYMVSNKVRIGLRIENAAGTTVLEKIKYNRNLRIDCIILEPVNN